MSAGASAFIAEFPRSIDRGLIEAHDGPRNRQGITDFRDQLIAASLKLQVRQDLGRKSHHFRDQLIAASLKRGVAAMDGGAFAYFRDQLIAASLKRGCALDVAAWPAEFPRSIDRGLIEAVISLPASSKWHEISAIN